MKIDFLEIWKYLIEKNQNENFDESNYFITEASDTTNKYDELDYLLEANAPIIKNISSTSDLLNQIVGTARDTPIQSAFRKFLAEKFSTVKCISEIISKICNNKIDLTHPHVRSTRYGRELYRLKYSQIDDSTFKPLQGISFEIPMSELRNSLGIQDALFDRLLKQNIFTGIRITVVDVSKFEVHKNQNFVSGSYKSVELTLQLDLILNETVLADKIKNSNNTANNTNTTTDNNNSDTNIPDNVNDGNNTESSLQQQDTSNTPISIDGIVIDKTSTTFQVYITSNHSNASEQHRKAFVPNKVIPQNMLDKYLKIDEIVQNIKYDTDQSGELTELLRNILIEISKGSEISSSDIINLEKIYNIQTTGEYIKFNPDIEFGISDQINKNLQTLLQLLPPEYHNTFRVDFSEVFGAVCLAMCCRKITGISDIYIKFPSRANEPLADYFISNKPTEQLDKDSFKISAKTGEGCNPSSKSALAGIEEFLNANNTEIDRVISAISSNTLSKDDVKNSIYSIREINKILSNKLGAFEILIVFASVFAAILLSDSSLLSRQSNTNELYTNIEKLIKPDQMSLSPNELEVIKLVVLKFIDPNSSAGSDKLLYNFKTLYGCIEKINKYINSTKCGPIGSINMGEKETPDCLHKKILILLGRLLFANINISDVFIKTFNRLFAKQIGTFMQVHLDDKRITDMINNKQSGDIEFLGKAVSANGEKLTADTFEHQFYFSYALTIKYPENNIDDNNKVQINGGIPKIHLEKSL